MLWVCQTCGVEHEGLPLDWAHDEPTYWAGARTGDDHLGSDLCTWTDDDGRLNYFIRGVIYIPVPEIDDTFRYGVWSSLSLQSYERVRELWDEPSRVEEPPYFGWLSNKIPGYPATTLNLPLNVVTDDLDLRPRFVLRDADHPLVEEQRSGISVERLLELIELNLHR